jgi:hypothetical protein
VKAQNLIGAVSIAALVVGLLFVAVALIVSITG